MRISKGKRGFKPTPEPIFQSPTLARDGRTFQGNFDMNRFTLLGNLGSDAAIHSKTNANGEDYEFAMLNLAVTTPEGQGKTRTDWFSIAVFQPWPAPPKWPSFKVRARRVMCGGHAGTPST